MRPYRWMAYIVVCLFYAATLQAAEVRKLGVNDFTYVDFTSPAGHAVKGVHPIDVRSYGAVEDTQTDAVMTANVTAIKAAIDAAGTTWGAVLDLGGRIYHTNDILLAQNRQSNPVRIKNGRIYGHNIAGPVINAGGSTLIFENVHVYVDNCYSAIWMYRTTTNGGGFNKFHECSFAGTATQAMIYSVASEVNDFISCHLQQQSDAPGYLSANTNRLNLTLPLLSTNSAYGGSGESNAVFNWIGGSAWADVINSTANAVFRIFEGNNFRISGVSGANLGDTPFIELGNTEGNSCDEINVFSNRSETGGKFIVGRGNVNRLYVVGNTPNSDNVVTWDNNYTVAYSTFANNSDLWNGNIANYVFWNLQYSHFDEPYANLTVNNGILATTGRARRPITLNGLGADQYSQIYEQDFASDGALRRMYDTYKQMTAEPTYAATIGTVTLPDGTSWNPAGLKGKFAVNLASETGAGAWYQIPVIRSLTPPASSTAAGTVGQFSMDASYFYFCYSDNNWRRVAIDGTW